VQCRNEFRGGRWGIVGRAALGTAVGGGAKVVAAAEAQALALAAAEAVAAEQGCYREDEQREDDEPKGDAEAGVGGRGLDGSADREAEAEGGGEEPPWGLRAQVLVGEGRDIGRVGGGAVGAVEDDSALAGEEGVGGVAGLEEDGVLMPGGAGPEDGGGGAEKEGDEGENRAEEGFEAGRSGGHGCEVIPGGRGVGTERCGLLRRDSATVLELR